jgi:membrane protein involved in colicin uptake
VLTADSEETIRINKAKEAKRKAEEEARKKQAEIERQERIRKEAEAKKKREQDAKKKSIDQLFGGINKSDGKATGGEGDDNKVGDKGQPNGNPYASSYFGSPGSGSGGKGYGLNGRSLKGGSGVKQDCNEEGRVVVKIEVDRNGRVVSATPGVRGTTNNHPCLLKPAKATAMKHRWNADSKAPSRQIGFVVVNFKLGE